MDEFYGGPSVFDAVAPALKDLTIDSGVEVVKTRGKVEAVVVCRQRSMRMLS